MKITISMVGLLMWYPGKYHGPTIICTPDILAA